MRSTFPTIDEWMQRRADERAKSRGKMKKLKVIQGGKQETQKPKSEAPTVRPARSFVDPIPPNKRAELARGAAGIVALATDPSRLNVAASLVASTEFAIAAKVPWSDFLAIARNEYIKTQARHKP